MAVAVRAEVRYTLPTRSWTRQRSRWTRKPANPRWRRKSGNESTPAEVTEEELQGLSAFTDLINELDMEDFERK